MRNQHHCFLRHLLLNFYTFVMYLTTVPEGSGILKFTVHATRRWRTASADETMTQNCYSYKQQYHLENHSKVTSRPQKSTSESPVVRHTAPTRVGTVNLLRHGHSPPCARVGVAIGTLQYHTAIASAVPVHENLALSKLKY